LIELVSVPAPQRIGCTSEAIRHEPFDILGAEPNVDYLESGYSRKWFTSNVSDLFVTNFEQARIREVAKSGLSMSSVERLSFWQSSDESALSSGMDGIKRNV